jgi:hypothetical protein
MWLLSVHEWMNQRVNTLVDDENSTRDYDDDSFLWIRMTYQYGMTYAIPTRNRIMCRQLTKAAAFFFYSILRLLHSLFQTLRNRSRVRLTPSRWSDRPARRLDCGKRAVTIGSWGNGPQTKLCMSNEVLTARKVPCGHSMKCNGSPGWWWAKSVLETEDEGGKHSWWQRMRKENTVDDSGCGRRGEGEGSSKR